MEIGIHMPRQPFGLGDPTIRTRGAIIMQPRNPLKQTEHVGRVRFRPALTPPFVQPNSPGLFLGATVCALIALLLPSTAAAAPISWTSDTFDADADVSTPGTAVEASFFVGPNRASGSGAAAPLTGEYGHTEASTGYRGLLDAIAYDSGVNQQAAELSGLARGRDYLVEFYYHHKNGDRTLTIDDGAGNDITLSDTSGASAGGIGTGTFTADAWTQAVNFDASSGSQFMNGYQLRELPIEGTEVLRVNIDDAQGPLDSTLPSGFETYTGQGSTVQFASSAAADGDIGVRVDSPCFRHANDGGYGDVPVLDPSADPMVGYNAVVNSGALVNQDQPGPLTVELSDLKAGRYNVQFYLHNIWDGFSGDGQGLWDISGAAIADDVHATFGFNSPNSNNGIPPADMFDIGRVLLEFSITQPGGSASFIFEPEQLASNGQLWVNGFELRYVPEPSTLALGCLWLAAMIIPRRRKR